ncbi:MAG TPA: EAL domain-containing protein [Thioalkalivibrio sp.]|nr:EAL domain-containing protein [Thioalkalivibrio sp.]
MTDAPRSRLDYLGLAGRCALYYGLFGIAWILFSDWLVSLAPLDAEQMRFVQSAKGIVFVALSVLLIYLMVRYETRHAERTARALASERQRLAAIIEGTRVGTWEWNALTGETIFSERWAEMLGYRLAELLPSTVDTWRDLTHPDDLAQAEALLARHFAGELDHYDCELRMRHRAGHWVWIHDRGQIVSRAADGRPKWVMGTHTDITARKEAEQRLGIAAVAFESQEGVMITDSDSRIEQVNRAFTRITGYEPEDVIGKTPAILRSGRHVPAFYAEMWQAIRERGYWEGEVWNRRKSGAIYPQWLSISRVQDEAGRPTHYVASFSDITDRKDAERRIHQLAFYDPLTHLANRRLLNDRLAHALATSARAGEHGAVLMLDLDRFKTLNDTRGHDAGDTLLVQVAQRLRMQVREADTIARLGGDEFVILLEALGGDHDMARRRAAQLAETIRTTLSQPYDLGAIREYQITPSIGATLFLGQATPMEDLFKQADVALYDAKSAGRNRVSFFDPGMQRAVEHRASLEAALRHAVDHGELELHFQPQVDRAGALVGAEALLRWPHARGVPVSPAEFIPLAEETGLIVPLGDWVLEQACRTLIAWNRSSTGAERGISVNVSARQFHQPDYLQRVTRILDETGADARLIKLELTESVVLGEPKDVAHRIHELRELGFRFSMDDFGTGYSSLSYLKRLPLDQVKIDASFVRDVLRQPSDAAIIHAIIAMGHSLDLEVIAEGVETGEQLRFLADSGCDAYQGFLFARPMPQAALLGYTPPATT